MFEVQLQFLLKQERVLSIDDSIQALLGFEPDAFLHGHVSIKSRIHAHDAEIAEALFAQNNAFAVSGSCNLRIRQANGRIRCVKAVYQKTPEPDEQDCLLSLRLQDAKSLYQPVDDNAFMINFKAMMENTDDYIYFKDRNHVFTGASQTLVSITDPSEHYSDLLGLTDYDVFPEAYADVYYRLEKQVFAGLPAVHEIQKTLDNQGNVGWVDNRKYPMRNDAGEIIGLFGIARVITENIQKQQKIEQLLVDQNVILENQLVGIATVKDRRIVWANKAFINLFGYSKDEVVGMPTRQFYAKKSDYLDIGAAYADLPNMHVLRREFEFVHKSGHKIWVNLSGTILNQSSGLSLWVFVDVSELKQTLLALSDSETKFRTLFEANSDAVMLLNEQGFISCNQATLELFGCGSVSEFCQTTPLDLSPTTQADGHMSATLFHEALIASKTTGSFEFEWLHKRLDNGHIFAAEVRLTSLILEGDQLWIAVVRDISARKLAEQEMRIAAVAFNSMEGISVTDSNGTILKVNPAFCKITGYQSQEVIGKNPSILQSGRHGQDFYVAMWESLNSQGAWEGEIWNRRKDGEIYPEYLTISAVKDAVGNITHYVATFHDITLSKASAEEIERLAFYDPLTNLPNRRLLLNRLAPALATSARTKNIGALLFIDLDNFKLLNDRYGHDTGDLVLQQVAMRLQACVRQGDTVAHLGGDEFVVMLEDLSTQPLDAARMAETISVKILEQLNKPYQLRSVSHYSTPSIGATLFNGHEQLPEDLLKHADIAMYEAKAAGRNVLRFFDQQMQANIDARAQLEDELRQAVNEGQFILFFQPQVLYPNRIGGAEVLLRWQHPQHGLVQPNDFIPIAEETGLILPIGQWVVEQACAQIKRWEQQSLFQALTLAVNVSARQFRQADFVQQVSQAIEQSGICASQLKLELTESLVLADLDESILKMRALRALGVRFSMDDFGTGYSSLGNLHKLPIDQLKIDKSFVAEISNDSEDKVIVQTIIAMANKLAMEVIAEGVETEQQKDYLAAQGCPFYQGYLFGKPMPLSAFEQLIKSE